MDHIQGRKVRANGRRAALEVLDTVELLLLLILILDILFLNSNLLQEYHQNLKKRLFLQNLDIAVAHTFIMRVMRKYIEALQSLTI